MVEPAKQEQVGYSTEHDDSSDEDYLDGPYGDSRDEEIPISEDVLSLIPVENNYGDRLVFDPYAVEGEGSDSLPLVNKHHKNYFKVFLMTWNMQGLSTPDEDYISSFLPLNKYHIYCFGSQECERSIGTSVLIDSKQKWEKTLSNVMGSAYVQLESCTLVALHVVIFIRKELKSHISNVTVSSVATGLYNQLGNKGGVSIAFKLGRRKFVFINNHLPAHQNNTEDRNDSFERIIEEVNYAGKVQVKPSKNKVNPANHTTSSSKLHFFKKTERPQIFKKNNFVFFLGDLNYRINGNRKVVDKVLKMNDLKVLLLNDQLQLEKKKGKTHFQHFAEGDITFPPTYKFEKNSNQYDLSKKQRIPAWTDRVLYKPSKKGKLELVDYNCFSQAKFSDHRPVYATFLVDAPGVTLERHPTLMSVKEAAASSVCSIQ